MLSCDSEKQIYHFTMSKEAHLSIEAAFKQLFPYTFNNEIDLSLLQQQVKNTKNNLSF